MPDKTRIALVSRKSPLALRQAALVADALRAQGNPNIDIIGLSTRGDKELSLPLAEIGGKELFIKCLQREILNGNGDAAVHSLKDMAAAPTPGFILVAVGFAEDARDAVVGNGGKPLAALPAGARIGTSSPRRAALMRRYYPKLVPVLLRGNIQRRLRAVENGACDAAVLAAAGLKRMGLEERISEYLSPSSFIPAVGQGLLAVECLADRPSLVQRLSAVNNAAQMRRARAERAFAAAMEGDCHTALGAHALVGGDGGVMLRAFYQTPAGLYCDTETRATGDEAADLAGQRAAENILKQLQ